MKDLFKFAYICYSYCKKKLKYGTVVILRYGVYVVKLLQLEAILQNQIRKTVYLRAFCCTLLLQNALLVMEILFVRPSVRPS